jgi:hypothetical protein
MTFTFLHHIKSTFAAAILVSLLSASVAFAQTPSNPNIVKNAGFESDHMDWRSPLLRGYVVDNTAHTGTHSLYIENDDKSSEAAFEQILNVRPGQKLFFSGWIKGDVKGPGAGIKIESYNGSQYLDGFIPVSKKGTFGWSQITGEFTVPAGATKTIISPYLQKYLASGTTGKAWFDDIEVRSIPFEITAQHPNYRGFVKQGDNAPLRFALAIHAEPHWQKSPVKIYSTLTNAQGKVLLRRTYSISSTTSYSLKITPPRNLPIGDYKVNLRVVDPNGHERLVRNEALRVVREMPRVYIDEQGFTVVNGKRFFPMGLYLGTPTEDDLARIAAGGFNTVLSYSWNPKNPNPEEYMDIAAKHHLKVIYSLKDLYPNLDGTRSEAFGWAKGIINRMKDKPALLAWYTNDERAPGIGWLPNLEKMYELARQEDPNNHPTFQAQNKYASLPQSYGVTDILAMDLYPVGWGDDLKLGITSAETRRVARTMRGVKGTWAVPQIFDWAVYNKGAKQIPPTLDEMRNQSYQAIINGATGLIYYSYFDLWFTKAPRGDETRNAELFHKRWEDVTAMAREIDAIIPVILEDRKVLLDLPENPQTEIGKLQDGNQQLFRMASPSFAPQVEVGAFQDGNRLMLLMANPDTKENSITFALPPGWKIKDANQGEIKSTFANGKATFALPAVGSGVFYLGR